MVVGYYQFFEMLDTSIYMPIIKLINKIILEQQIEFHKDHQMSELIQSIHQDYYKIAKFYVYMN